MADSSLENASETVTNATAEKIPASPEGMLLAYGALFSMAVISIYIGSLKSIKYHKKQQVSNFTCQIYCVMKRKCLFA